MKKFRFKFDTSLRIKNLKERLDRYRLAETIIERDKEQNYLDELKLTNKNIKADINTKLNKSVTVNVLSDYGNYTANIKTLIDSQKELVKKATDLYEEARHSFLESRKERQIFDKLKEKRHNEYFKEMNRAEQIIIDELANVNYSRLERDKPDEGYYKY